MKHEQEKLIFPRIIMWDLERLSGFIWQRKRLEIWGLWFDERPIVFKFCKENEFFMISMYEYDKWFVGIYELMKLSGGKRWEKQKACNLMRVEVMRQNQMECQAIINKTKHMSSKLICYCSWKTIKRRRKLIRQDLFQF
jgi:hypothetical protein